MIPLASEGGLQVHLPEGLWPVYVAAGSAVVCVLASAVLSFITDPWVSGRRRLDRLFAFIGGAFLIAAMGLYVYADSRYQECIDEGNHPWWTDHFDSGRGVCDRAVFGRVVKFPRS